MATKLNSRQTIKTPDPDALLKGSQQKLKVTSPKGVVSKAIKMRYRTMLLDEFQIEERSPLTWLHLSADQVQDLKACPVSDLPAKVAAIFQYHVWETDLKESIWVALYVGCIKFARDSDFSPAQISAFFSMYKTAVDRSVTMPMTGILTYMRTMIICHSGSVGDDWDVFGPREAKLCIDYTFSSLFQHFRLYKQFLTKEQCLVELHVTKTLEVPTMIPLPLSEAIPKDQYDMEMGLVDNNSVTSNNEDENDGDLKSSENNIENGQVEDKKDVQKAIVQENPLDLLSPEEVRQVTADTINSLFLSVNQEYELLFEEQKSKFMNQISKFVNH